ncbi:hypothetical protein N9N71_03940 [Synechococcus sp. AH-229-G18]|nr:hypothetical protein [Synechococcus sp. AH-229-G18]
MLDAYSAALVVGAPIIRNSCKEFCRNLLLDIDFGEDFKPFNPSLAMINDHAFGIARVDNISPHLDQIYTCNTQSAKNLFYQLNADLSVVNFNWLSFQSIPEDLESSWLSFEDLRLFSWQENLWAIGALHIQYEYDGILDFSKMVCRQALARLEGNKMILHKIFPSPLKLKEEKNWVPLVIGEDLYFVYSVDPLVLFKFTGEGLTYSSRESKKPSSHEKIRLRGGTQFVHWKGGLYLGIAHQQRIKTHKFYYLHELAVFDSKQMKMIETSEPFFLHKRGIEFAAGIMRCGDSMVISYGVSDAACYVNRLTDQDLEDWLIS